MSGLRAASAERFARSGGRVRELVVILALAAAYYLAARLGLLLAFDATNASPFWPPSGIALAAILLLGNRVWPGIALGAFVSNVVVFAANEAAGFATITAVSAAIACGNTPEALLGAYVLRRTIGVNTPDEPQEVLKFALISLVVCMPAALVGMASLILSGIAPAGAYGTIWLTWWLGDATGVMIAAPAILAWANARLRWNRALALEIAASLAALLAVGWLVFGRELRVDGGDRLGAYLFIPAIAWAAYRFGARGVATASLLVSGIAVWGTTQGLGPFARGSLNDALILLEIFIGLCAVTGLVLAADLAQRRRLPGAPARLADIAVPWATLLAGIAVAVLGWHLIAADTDRSARDRFEYLVNGIEARIAERMQAYGLVLRGGTWLFAASKSVERDEWREYVQRLRLDENYPGIQGVGYAKRIAPAERDEHVRQIRAEGFSDYTIRPAGERDEYTSIIYLEPFSDRNLRAFGFDMFTEPVRRAAMSNARDTGETALSGKVKLVQEAEKDVQAGFLIYVPVYRNGAPVATTVERRAALEGYVYSPFRMNNLIRGMLDKELNGLALQIFDGESASPEALMYDNHAERGTQTWHPLFTAEAVMKIEDHSWTLRVASLPEFEAGVDRQKAQVVLIAGIAVGLLLFIIVRSLAVTRVRAFALANDMTAAVRESEVKFRSLAESASEAIIIADQEGRIVSWNRGAHAMFGHAEAEIVGQPLTVLMPERFHAAHSLGLQRMRQTGEGRLIGRTVEFMGLRKDGSEFPLELSLASWTTSAGRFYSGIIRDVTDRKRAEEFLKGTFEESPDAALVVDGSGSIVRANKQSEKLFGYPRDRLLQLRVTDLIPERFRSRHDAHVGKYFASPRRRLMGAGLELRGLRMDGTEFPLDVMLSPLSGSGLVIAIIRDVTERKRTEDGLRISEERFQFISRATNDVVWDWNPITNEQWWSEAFQTTFGYQPEEIETASDFWTDRLHPDDRERVTQHIHQVIESGGQAWSQEYRFRRADGTYAIVVDRGYVVRNDKGEPVRMLGSMMDITERKRNEEELRASEERFRLVVDGVTDYAILMLDPHGHIASWNAAAERIKGYRAEEIIGEHFSCCYSKADVERGQPQRALEVAAAEGRYEDEGWRLRKDGSAFWANVVITALRDESGNLRGFAKVTRDLTDRKREQEAISSALKEKEILLKEVYHRVKNNLQVITSLLNLQLRTLPHGESRAILKTSAERVRAMALVHEMLYQSGNLSSIAIGEYIRDLCTRLRTATGADERGITLIYDIEPIEIGLEIAVPLGLLLNELISNSLKHAFPEGKKGNVKIALKRCNDESMRLTVADNGVGLPPEMSFATSPSLGLKLVSTLAAQLDGELKFESREGTEVALNFGRRAKERAAA